VFYGIGDRTFPSALEAAGVSIVAVGGKTSIPLVHAILTLVGIPVYSLFDADRGFESRAKICGKAQDKIDEERNKHAKENRAALRYFGLAEEDFPSAIVADEVAIFEDHLEAFLSEHWTGWVTACENVETAAGISLAKNQLAYRIATLNAQGDVPDMLAQIMNKAEGK
jgi:putative ATP-dependent endonuclease of OLD family